MKRRMLLTIGSLSILATGADFMGQGSFQSLSGTDTDPKYLKIRGDSGFYCILDDKSSFRFEIIGDSMTTPMNGKDRNTYAPGSGNVQIMGEEKGEPYFTVFAPRPEGQYPAACVQEEAKLYGPVSLGSLRIGPEKGKAGPGPKPDLLGRRRDAAKIKWR
jgi:hypothetical protein